MYLFAQRVRSVRGETGINAGLYVHEQGLADDFWGSDAREIIRVVTTRDPGRRVRARVAVAEGGNAVESYLDVMGPDGVDAREIRDAVAALAEALRRGRPPLIARHGRITTVFGANLGTADLEAELGALEAAAIVLYEDQSEPAWKKLPPLGVIVTHDEAGWRFRLDDDSARRVLAAGGAPANVGIRHDVADDFRREHGKLYPFVAEWVTGLERGRVLELGGARFVDGEKVLSEWPDRK